MTKNILKNSLILGTLFTLFSCSDDVDVEKYVNTNFLAEGAVEYVFPDPPADVKRKVLLEDFTGHRCGNCPRAAEKIAEIIGNSPYSEQVIAVAVHGDGGDFNAFDPNADMFFYDFTTPEGIDLDRHFGVSAKGLPNGLINRVEYNNDVIVGYSNWQSAIDVAIAKDPVAWVDVHAVLMETDMKYINIDTRIKMLEAYPNPINVNVILVENNIVNWQIDYDANPKAIENYVHKHVMRYNHETYNHNIYGTWGIELNGSSANVDEIKRVSTSLDGTDWNLDNLYAIAYIYDATTKEILQVNEAHVSK